MGGKVKKQQQKNSDKELLVLRITFHKGNSKNIPYVSQKLSAIQFTMNALDNDMYNELEGRCLYISGGYPSSTAKMQPNHGEP